MEYFCLVKLISIFLRKWEDFFAERCRELEIRVNVFFSLEFDD